VAGLHIGLIVAFGLLGLYFGNRLSRYPLLKYDLGDQNSFPPIAPLAQVRDDLTRDSVRDHILFRSLTWGCYGAAGMALLLWLIR